MTCRTRLIGVAEINLRSFKIIMQLERESEMSLELSKHPLLASARASLTLFSAALVALAGASPGFCGTMSLPGSFSVSPTGAANYSIPIALPPGTAGMTPTLALEYNSQSPNGLLGVGWSLSGLPSITRCGRTFVQDGVFSGINFDANDRFCMDGQRLVAISGTYGADGTQYRTEVETFSKIISHGGAGSGPAWFEVHTKSGQVMEFGNTSDSRILSPGRSSAMVWALDRTTDVKGNYFLVTYTNDTTNGQYWPTRIDYTGNISGHLSPYNSVQFSYATRPDYVLMYQQGGMNRTTVRLTDVKTYAGSSLVSDYRLAYQQSPSSSRSELASVTACGADGSCMPATTFGWSTGATAFSQQSQGNPNSWNFGAPGSAQIPISGDFNGDGITDIAMVIGSGYYLMLGNGDTSFRSGGAFNHPNGWNFGSSFTSQYNSISGDFNGDGKTDFALLTDQYSYTFLSNGDGTFSGVAKAYASGSNFGVPPENGYAVLTGDFNGDGRTDFAMVATTNYWVFTSNGDGTFLETGGINPNGWNVGSPAAVFSGPTAVISPYHQAPYVGIAGDFNGDGKADLAFLGSQDFVVLQSNGDGTFSAGGAGAYPGGFNFGTLNQPPTQNYAPFAGDFNGDGKTDFGFFANTGYYTFISRGDGTFAGSSGQNPNGWNFGSPPTSSYVVFMADFNGDGRGDLGILGGQSYALLTSNGDGSFSAGAGGVYPIASTNLGTPPSSAYYFFPGDYLGNGKTSVALLRGANNSVLSVPGSVNDVMTSVIGGLGSSVSITYDSLVHAAIYNGGYTKATNATYPTQDLQIPMYVVSRVDTSNGIGGSYSSGYTYSWAKLDLRGRGFLGFGQTGVKDLQTGISDTTNYHQDFPYIGLVSSTTRTVGSQTLGQSTNTYQFSNASGGSSVSAGASVSSAPYQVSLSQNVSSGADLDGSALPTVTTANQYDAYLNATQVVVSTPDGFSKTTTNSYINDTTNWYLGRLTRATVSNVAP